MRGLIAEHVDQLKQVASFDAASFGDAYPAIRDTYDHMFMIGDGLAGGIISQFPRTFTGSRFAFSPATDLRLRLDRLFGEHTQLATMAMRAVLTDAPDLAAAATALDENSEELRHWLHHTDLYVDYVAATLDGDEAGRQAALDELRAYRSDFTAFLAGANPFLPADDFESLVPEHGNLLVSRRTVSRKATSRRPMQRSARHGRRSGRSARAWRTPSHTSSPRSSPMPPC